MDSKQNLYDPIDKLVTVKNFDLSSFAYNFKRLVDNIYFFHNVIGKNAANLKKLSSIKYDIPDSKKPREGQIAYFYIENSYPKEIYNSHWCLVLKDLGNTMIVIPTTSIKNDSIAVDKRIEMIIKIKNFEEAGCSKLKIHQVFSADLMRIDKSKKIYNLQTDFNYVKDKISKVFFGG